MTEKMMKFKQGFGMKGRKSIGIKGGKSEWRGQWRKGEGRIIEKGYEKRKEEGKEKGTKEREREENTM